MCISAAIFSYSNALLVNIQTHIRLYSIIYPLANECKFLTTVNACIRIHFFASCQGLNTLAGVDGCVHDKLMFANLGVRLVCIVTLSLTRMSGVRKGDSNVHSSLFLYRFPCLVSMHF